MREGIRVAARNERIQKIFEFFVVRAVSPTKASASAESKPTENQEGGGKRQAVPAGEILAVGHYDPNAEQLEIGAWEDVSLYLSKEEGKKKK